MKSKSGAKSKPTIASIVRPNKRNPNKGTANGHAAIERSLQQYGFGRPLVAAKDGTLIGGNQTYEQLLQVGIVDDPIIVRSRGDRPIVHIREDLSPNDAKAIGLSVADNRANEVGLEWDKDILSTFDMKELAEIFGGKALDRILASENLESQNIEESWAIIVECKDEQQQTELLEKLVAEGHTCRALIS